MRTLELGAEISLDPEHAVLTGGNGKECCRYINPETQGETGSREIFCRIVRYGTLWLRESVLRLRASLRVRFWPLTKIRSDRQRRGRAPALCVFGRSRGLRSHCANRRSALRPRPNIRGEGRDGFGNSSARFSRRQVFYFHRRAAFHSTQNRCVLKFVGRRERDEALLCAKRLDQRALPSTQHLQRQYVKMAENPQNVDSLKKCRPDVARSQRREHAQHTVRQLLHPHIRSTRRLEVS